MRCRQGLATKVLTAALQGKSIVLAGPTRTGKFSTLTMVREHLTALGMKVNSHSRCDVSILNWDPTCQFGHMKGGQTLVSVNTELFPNVSPPSDFLVFIFDRDVEVGKRVDAAATNVVRRALSRTKVLCEEKYVIVTESPALMTNVASKIFFSNKPKEDIVRFPLYTWGTAEGNLHIVNRRWSGDEMARVRMRLGGFQLLHAVDGALVVCGVPTTTAGKLERYVGNWRHVNEQIEIGENSTSFFCCAVGMEVLYRNDFFRVQGFERQCLSEELPQRFELLRGVPNIDVPWPTLQHAQRSLVVPLHPTLYFQNTGGTRLSGVALPVRSSKALSTRSFLAAAHNLPSSCSVVLDTAGLSTSQVRAVIASATSGQVFSIAH